MKAHAARIEEKIKNSTISIKSLVLQTAVEQPAKPVGYEAYERYGDRPGKIIKISLFYSNFMINKQNLI